MNELERHLMIERYLMEHGTTRSRLASQVGCDRSWITLVLKHGARPSRRLREALLARGVPEPLLAPARPDPADRQGGPDEPGRPEGAPGPKGAQGLAGAGGIDGRGGSGRSGGAEEVAGDDADPSDDAAQR